ncbi:hypothetical protein JXB22_02265 [candidate division WOR-3 bacterium]|nr:hypothetical protein [candidate division WOR-3 bacterium]
MRRIVTIIVIPLLLCATKYAGEFQELGVGGRACAMGATGIAAATDPSMIYFNPALSRYAQKSVLAMHAENFGGVVKNEFAALVLPRSNMSLGVALQYVSVGEIILTRLADTTAPPGSTNPPVPYDTVGTQDLVVYLNGAKGTDLIAYGANIKIFYRDLAVATGYGGGVDAGLAFMLPNLRVGLALRDLILSPIIWSNGTKETIITRVSLGVAPVFSIDRIAMDVMFACDVTKRIDVQGFDINLGCEIAYKNLLYGRLGLYDGDYTLGAGVKYKRFSLDYAFLTHSELDNTNKISAGLIF